VPTLPSSCRCRCDCDCRCCRWKSTPKRFALAGGAQWFAPTTLTDLVALQQQFHTAAPNTVKYVCGNTGYGVEKYYNAGLLPTPYSVSAAASARARRRCMCLTRLVVVSVD
jgi:hypothetical protein